MSYACDVYTHMFYTCYTHNGILLNHKEEWKFAAYSSMAGLEGHYTKWNKSDREIQILYDVTYMWNLRNTTA